MPEMKHVFYLSFNKNQTNPQIERPIKAEQKVQMQNEKKNSILKCQ